MAWHGYIRPNGECLLTPLAPDDPHVNKWRNKERCTGVSGLSMEDTIELARQNGAQRLIAHAPPHWNMIEGPPFPAKE